LAKRLDDQQRTNADVRSDPANRKQFMSLGLILIIVLLVFLFGGFSVALGAMATASEMAASASLASS
jgi:hypothetical protein